MRNRNRVAMGINHTILFAFQLFLNFHNTSFKRNFFYCILTASPFPEQLSVLRSRQTVNQQLITSQSDKSYTSSEAWSPILRWGKAWDSDCSLRKSS